MREDLRIEPKECLPLGVNKGQVTEEDTGNVVRDQKTRVHIIKGAERGGGGHYGIGIEHCRGQAEHG